MLHGEGIDRFGEIVDIAALHNIVEKSGAWYSYNGERVGQGRDSAIQFLKDNPDMAASIEQAIYNKLGINRKVAIPAPKASVAPTATSAAVVDEDEDKKLKANSAAAAKKGPKPSATA